MLRNTLRILALNTDSAASARKTPKVLPAFTPSRTPLKSSISVCHLLADYFEAIKKDFKKARKVYKSNCEDYNYAMSCFKYGNYVALGKGGGKADLAASMQYFDKACKGGDYRGCFQQGQMLITDLSTHGIQRDVKKVYRSRFAVFGSKGEFSGGSAHGASVRREVQPRLLPRFRYIHSRFEKGV